jgi:hypothetical protein
MTRTFKITDHGKDWGSGRYVVEADDGHPQNEQRKIGTNIPAEVMIELVDWLAIKEER